MFRFAFFKEGAGLGHQPKQQWQGSREGTDAGRIFPVENLGFQDLVSCGKEGQGAQRMSQVAVT